jgi:phage tail-like protein
MSLAARKDPIHSFRFKVEISGLLVGGFSEVSGLEANTEFDEYREGGVNDYTHKLPKTTKYSNLILKKGMTDSKDLFNWHQDVVVGNIQRKNITIFIVDATGTRVREWTFQDAFPIKWTRSELKADSNSLSVESIEIAHHGLVRV